MAKFLGFPTVTKCSFKEFSKEKIPYNRAGIYAIVNKVSDKVYIGQTNRLYARLREHRIELRGNRHGNRILQAAFNLYGEGHWSFIVIEFCAFNMLCERENLYLSLIPVEKRFNVIQNGEHVISGRKHRSEALKRISENNAFSERVEKYDKDGNLICSYKSMTEAARQHNCSLSVIKNAAHGRSLSSCGFIWKFENPEKRAVADERRRLKIENRQVFIQFITAHFRAYHEKNRGKKMSDYVGHERAAELAENTRRRTIERGGRNFYKKVGQYLPTGELVAEFEALKFAAKSVGAKRSSPISAVCRGRYKTAFGFVWKYI